MTWLAAELMRRFPRLVARSGNATGSDQAWARGVNSVDPRRLQLVLPVPNYRRTAIDSCNDAIALREVAPDDFAEAGRLSEQNYRSGPDQDPTARYATMPEYKRAYLERDALKVLGYGDYRGRRQKATAALLHLNPKKANGGGTGHTLRLCTALKVPVFLSDDWLTWLRNEPPAPPTSIGG